VSISGQGRPPVPQQRHLLRVKRKQRIGPDLMRHGKARPAHCRIAAKHLFQHRTRQIIFF
jgi:hypothetical protein